MLCKPFHKYGQCSADKTVATSDANPQSLCYVHGLEEAVGATLSFRLAGPVLNAAGAAGTGTVRVTVTTLGANGGDFVRVFYMTQVERRVRLTGFAFTAEAKMVTRNLFGSVDTAGPAGNIVKVVSSITDQPDDPTGDLEPLWFTTPTAAWLTAAGVANSEDRYSGPGTLLDCAFSLTNLGGTAALWLYVWDSPTAAAAVAAVQQPIIPPVMLTAVGQNADFTDEVRPGATFDTGLSWGLSNRADKPVLQPGSAGRFDWKGGL